MAVEARRGCGYRKVGGIYLAADHQGTHCCKIPFDLKVCPTCHAGIKQARGWTWIDPRPFMGGPCRQARMTACPFNSTEWSETERCGLIWIGEQFYPRPSDFTLETGVMGFSRRIRAIPRGFRTGVTWVLFAHPRLRNEAVPIPGSQYALNKWVPGVFLAVRPSRIEKIITDVQAKNREAMEQLRYRGITPVIVPADDPDHAARKSPVMEPEFA